MEIAVGKRCREMQKRAFGEGKQNDGNSLDRRAKCSMNDGDEKDTYQECHTCYTMEF